MLTPFSMTYVDFGMAYVGLVIAEAYVELRFIILMCGNVCLAIENFLTCFRNIWIL